jgi:hypothetical protein
MGVKMQGKCKAVIPLTEICCDFLKDISLKESNQQRKRQNKEVCNVTNKTEFWYPDL